MRNQLLARRIDLAFLLGPLPEAEVANLDLCRYPLAWVASPKLALDGRPLSLERVAQWPVVTYPASSRPHQNVRDMLTAAEVENVRMFGSASLSTTVRMVQDGLGVGVIAPAVLRRELAEGQLCLLDVRDASLPALSFTASWLRGRDSHVAAAVARLAVQVANASSIDHNF
jgi:DNA-binding transcriptional LysR family regulator